MSNNISFTQIMDVSRQYKHLQTIQADLKGLYVLPRENDIFTWDGIIFVTEGVWERGIFKFTLTIPAEYSIYTLYYSSNKVKIPTLKFFTPLFHPYVDPEVSIYKINVRNRQIVLIFNMYVSNGGRIRIIWQVFCWL